jgi:hypothetical protein
LAAASSIVGGIAPIYTFGGRGLLTPFNTVEVYIP